jgi:hypothetical protein
MITTTTRKPRLWPRQQAEKLTQLIQMHARHAVVTVSGFGCFYLLSEPYIDPTGERQWKHAQLIGASYGMAALKLNRLYGASLDPARGHSW